MLLWENMKLALTAIKANKMRSVLTMLGIIIGIGSVISIVSIGATMRSVLADEYESIGLNTAIVYTSNVDEYRMSDYFGIDDITQLQEAFGGRIKSMDPYYYESINISRGRNNLKVRMQGVPGNYDQVKPMNIAYGRMLNQQDLDAAKHHVVIEDKTAKKLFGKENAVGETVRATIHNELEDLLIVGIYSQEVSLLNALMSGGGDLIYVPYTLVFGPEDINFALNVYLADDIDIELFETQFLGLLSRMKDREPSNYYFETAQNEMSMVDDVMRGLSLAVGAIAAISLLVGGIGIMNIMLVSVTERTREIGIRKALGARDRDIKMQFLIESAIISAAGGIIGTALGLGLILLGGLLVGIGVAVNPLIIVVAVGFSALVGIFFGLYPASRAAQADPIVALRYE
ncbi:MAG: ABC transporter permease [Syntrophomonadaceae bacterium]|nr:ABC transporter permease [Syntrophomonadaceae bacterium]